MHPPSNPAENPNYPSPEIIAPGAKPCIVAGWDIGGAHLKCALTVDSRVVDAFCIETPLWIGLEPLEVAFEQALQRLDSAATHVVTMTGELSDLFEDRAHGVQELTDLAAARLSPLLIYAGRAGFLNADHAIARVADVASANWHATASLVALKLRDGLVVDIGSTTTDLVPVVAGTVVAAGNTDAERLATGELLYTGATRTPVMAVCARVPFAGQWRTLMAEHFATMADVYRLTGALHSNEAPQKTADGRGLSLAECRARLARMIGWDAEDAPDQAWDDLAHYLSERQLANIFEGAALVLSRCVIAPDAPIVGAGSGRFLTRSLANRIGRPYRDVYTLIDVVNTLRAAVSEAAPACAVALLAQARGQHLIPTRHSRNEPSR